MRLRRVIGVPGAIAIGLGAMIGAGLFFVWAPAAALAGAALPVAVAFAALVAILNALSTAQLAMRHPVSGGAYAYARAEVAAPVGFVAGVAFLTGKTASAGAIALIVGAHLWPEHAKFVAALAIAGFAIVNMLGVRVTSWVSSLIVAPVIAAVLFALVWSVAGGEAAVPSGSGGLPVGGPYAVLQSAGLLFFAFAGYARMATLGEEVRNPSRTLPIAIVTALTGVLVLYSLVGWATMTRLGEALPESATPVADLVGGPLHAVMIVVAALACLGSLIGILAGLSRTGLAMARDGELPGALGRISRRGTPAVAETVFAVAAIAGVFVLPTVSLVAFSSTLVLTYYAIAHLAAIRMRRSGAALWLPRAVPPMGIALCAVLVATLPWEGVAAAVVWLALVFSIRAALTGRHRPAEV